MYRVRHRSTCIAPESYLSNGFISKYAFISHFVKHIVTSDLISCIPSALPYSIYQSRDRYSHTPGSIFHCFFSDFLPELPAIKLTDNFLAL